MRWAETTYIDTTLPFGLRSAPNIFTAVGDALAWILKDRGLTWMLKYIDDIPTIASRESSECVNNLHTIVSTCAELGLPLASEKVEGPSTCLQFLGIVS